VEGGEDAGGGGEFPGGSIDAEGGEVTGWGEGSTGRVEMKTYFFFFVKIKNEQIFAKICFCKHFCFCESFWETYHQKIVKKHYENYFHKNDCFRKSF
jgi:hypothetical protein